MGRGSNVAYAAAMGKHGSRHVSGLFGIPSPHPALAWHGGHDCQLHQPTGSHQGMEQCFGFKHQCKLHRDGDHFRHHEPMDASSLGRSVQRYDSRGLDRDKRSAYDGRALERAIRHPLPGTQPDRRHRSRNNDMWRAHEFERRGDLLEPSQSDMERSGRRDRLQHQTLDHQRRALHAHRQRHDHQ